MMVGHSIESLLSAPTIPVLAGSSAMSSSRSEKSSTAIGGRYVADRHFAAAWAEFERLRQLVPERADFHLANWGRWRKNDVVTVGYADHVPGLDKGIGRCVAEDASDHDYEAHDAHSAEVCDAIIDELPQMYRLAISNVYEASVWQFRSTSILEQALVDGAALFWHEAQKRDLI